MKEIVFVSEESRYKIHTLIAWLNMDADLVFNAREYYPIANGGDGREVNDYLKVSAGHKSRVLNLLGRAFNGVSSTCGEAADVRLFFMLERMAQGGHWKSLGEIEKWFMDRGIPFTKQKWVDIK